MLSFLDGDSAMANKMAMAEFLNSNLSPKVASLIRKWNNSGNNDFASLYNDSLLLINTKKHAVSPISKKNFLASNKIAITGILLLAGTAFAIAKKGKLI